MAKLIENLNKSVACIGLPILMFGAALSLSACGGGGGGGGGGGTTSSFNTSEFQANYALARINTLTAYDNSGTGSGVTVAVLDTGIDKVHTDLAANINAASDQVGSIVSGLQDTNGHGTQVAGVIGAVRNDTGTLGVAFSSSILAVKVSDDGTITNADAAAGIDFAIAKNAKVINMSFGGTTVSATTVAALQRAVDAGIIIIASAGNSGGANPEFDARLAQCTSTNNCASFGITFDAKNLMLAVGSVGTTNALSTFSNLAGDAAAAYVVAPGENIVTTALNGGTTSVSGTSFSAPHVAGAAALLLQRFPSLTTTQVVALLISSATDLGATGNDTTFGAGLINLKSAFSAQGISSIPTTSSVSGTSVPLNSSKVVLGTAFGNALHQYSFMGQAIILDAYQRAYKVDLRNNIINGTADLNVASFFEKGITRLVSTPMPDGLSLNFDVARNDETILVDEIAGFARQGGHNKTLKNDIGAIRFAADLNSDLTIHAAHRASAYGFFADTISEQASEGVFFNSGWTSSPQLALLGTGDSLKMSHDLDDRTKIDLGIHNSKGFSASTTSGAGHLFQAQISHAAKNGVRYGASAGYVAEESALFSSSTSGAFGSTDDNASQYLSLSASWKFDDKINLFGSYTETTVKPSFSGASLFNNWSRIQANSFTLGAFMKSSFTKGDRLGISIGQPLRVHSSSVDVTLPVGRDLNGNVLQETQRLDMTPSGHQTDLQVAYALKTSDWSEVSSFAKLSLQPGHDRAADPQSAIGIKWDLKF